MNTTAYLLEGTGTMVKLWVRVQDGLRKQAAQSCLELVLRRADGTFCPTYWLMSTLCHEVR